MEPGTLQATPASVPGALSGLTDRHAPYSLHFWLEEFEDNGDWCAVMRTARELLHLVPGNPEGLRYLAEAYFRMGKPVEAYETAVKLVKSDPCSIDGYWILSDLAAQADDLERSADFIERAARLIPNSDAIWFEVARANFNLGRLARCLVAADHGLRINPQNIRLLIYKVFCLAGLKSRQGARIAASRLASLGVDSEVLRETASDMGLSRALLAKLGSLLAGAAPELPEAAVKASRRKATAALDGGISLLSEITAKAAPLTPAQFAAQLARAEARHEAAPEDSDPGADEAEDHAAARAGGSDEALAADTVLYVYDRYRTHGPYTQEELRAFLRDGTFNVREAYVRWEDEGRWIPAAECGLAALEPGKAAPEGGS